MAAIIRFSVLIIAYTTARLLMYFFKRIIFKL